MKRDVLDIEISRVLPNLRSVYDADSIEELSSSIRHYGQLEPIRVWFAHESFRILDGEKRWRACKKIGMTGIKAVITEVERAAV